MTWTPLSSRVGEERTISKFLFFPTTINNRTKWLVRSTIIQKVTSYALADRGTVTQWTNVSWTK